jgi:sugar phosphate isomerase/epimerase
MKTIKGPAVFLARFQAEAAPFDTLDGLAEWASGLGYKGLQIPADPRLIDLETAATSPAYCDDLRARLARHGAAPTELSTHLQGQLVAVHPAYDTLFDGFAPASLRGNPPARQLWAIEQLTLAARASRNLGLHTVVTFSGALAWPYIYPWPQRPAGLVDAAFAELGRLWRPILDVFADCGINCAYELHPGEDLHDGASFDRFLDVVDHHASAALLFDPSHFVLQCLDYLAFIDIYHDRIKAFHAKDAEFNPTGRSGLYGGYQGWLERPGRFRSLGHGQVNFRAIFSKLAQYDFPGWAVLEWESALEHPEDGARAGAVFIAAHIIRVTDRAFDDFAATAVDAAANADLLGLSR